MTDLPALRRPHATALLAAAGVITGCLSWAVPAAAASPFDGTWTVTWTNRGGSAEEAKLVLADRVGTFQRRAHSARNPCVGRETPLELDVQSPTSAIARLFGSKAMAGCPDGELTLTKTSDDALTVTMGRGNAAQAVRAK
jgi:hypothetical protein